MAVWFQSDFNVILLIWMWFRLDSEIIQGSLFSRLPISDEVSLVRRSWVQFKFLVLQSWTLNSLINFSSFTAKNSNCHFSERLAREAGRVLPLKLSTWMFSIWRDLTEILCLKYLDFYSIALRFIRMSWDSNVLRFFREKKPNVPAQFES